MQLLDDLLKQNEERNDERRAISTGTVKQNCKKFENKCQLQNSKKSAKSEVEKSSKIEFIKSNVKETSNEIEVNIECSTSNNTLNDVIVNVPKDQGQHQVMNAEMVKSITSSTSMSSSITETTQVILVVVSSSSFGRCLDVDYYEHAFIL